MMQRHSQIMVALISMFLAGTIAYAQEIPTLVKLNRHQATVLGFHVTSESGTPNERVYIVTYPPMIRDEYKARSTIVEYQLKSGGSLITRSDFLAPSKSPEVAVGSTQPVPDYRPSLEVWYKCVKKSCSEGDSVQYSLDDLQSFVEK